MLILWSKVGFYADYVNILRVNPPPAVAVHSTSILILCNKLFASDSIKYHQTLKITRNMKIKNARNYRIQFMNNEFELRNTSCKPQL